MFVPQYKRTIQNEVDVEFNDYALYDYNESLPTPSSGASTGLDLFIVVSIYNIIAGDGEGGRGRGREGELTFV